MKNFVLYFLTISTALGFGYMASASRIKYLTDKNIKSIQSEFRRARPITKKSLSKISNKLWTCKLMGMRSRMDIGKTLNLYQLNSQVENNKLNVENFGAQMVKSYKTTRIGLYGKVGPYLDLVRLNRKGQLISELSLDTKRKKGGKREVKSVFYKRPKTVVSYAICNS